MSTCPVSLVPRLPHLLGSHPSSCVVAWYITDRIRLLGSELIEMTHFDSPREGVSGARVQTPKCLPCSSRHHLMLLNLYDNDWHAHRRFLDTCKQEAYKKPRVGWVGTKTKARRLGWRMIGPAMPGGWGSANPFPMNSQTLVLDVCELIRAPTTRWTNLATGASRILSCTRYSTSHKLGYFLTCQKTQVCSTSVHESCRHISGLVKNPLALLPLSRRSLVW